MAAPPKSLIRAYRSTHTLVEGGQAQRGKDAYGGSVIVWMSGRDHGCVLGRLCGHTSFPEVVSGREPASRYLYKMQLESGAKGMERDSVCAQLNLTLKQAVCSGCNGKLQKKQSGTAITYDEAALEALQHLFGITTTRATLVADWRRCVDVATTAPPPAWAPKGVLTFNPSEAAHEGYQEPASRNWAEEASRTPESLKELVRDADARRERRDAARTAQRLALETHKRKLDELDAAAEAEAAATVPIRALFAKAQKNAARKPKIAEAEEASRRAAECARMAAEAGEREARARAELAALSDEESSDDDSCGTVAVDERGE